MKSIDLKPFQIVLSNKLFYVFKENKDGLSLRAKL